MRRAVTLFLLPLEVFAGIAYELKIAHEASQDIELSVQGANRMTTSVYSYQRPPPVEGSSLSASSLSAADTAADADLLLDLGEAFDLPCAFAEKLPSLITSPPGHATYCDKSIVTAVPIPPAI